MKTVRSRYIAFEMQKQSGVYPTRSSFIEAIIGRLRLAKDQPVGLRFRIVEYDYPRFKGIVKTTPHTAVEWMKALLGSVNEICGWQVTIRVLGTSGTLKALREKYLDGHKLTKNDKSS
ncbi:MAG: Rpp14/Pop5 family protein [Promethearchaeati archaeon SRVP18_Atabeyarchaeia-1]